MHHSKNKNLIYLIFIVFFINCEGEVGPQGIGLNSLTNVTNEPAGTNCENGGVKIEVGTDSNENGVLDSDESQSTSYVCNGVDGAISLTTVTTEPAGTNCENGGLKIDSGVDVNGNGTLEDTEISTTAYVCNGIDGNNSLTKITNEAAGTNCENGGLKIDTGVDVNSDGTLDDTEISTTVYVCNGIDGNNTLTKITNEAAGTNCGNGGLKIDTGVDVNVDGALSDTEITATAYACNGLNGNISLVNISNESAGANCANGGVKIESGIDDNGDGTLDNNEVQITRFICKGLDGETDEQIRFKLEDECFSLSEATTTCWARNGGPLRFFDIRNYLGVDSVVFIVYGVETLQDSFFDVDVISDISIQLFDITNNTPINGTTFVTDNIPENTFISSGNIISNLPNEQIELGVQWIQDPNIFARIDDAYLLLFRNN